MWGYWSTDGLGLFEYMLLVEELQTEPVWVINNGVAHGDSELEPPIELHSICLVPAVTQTRVCGPSESDMHSSVCMPLRAACLPCLPCLGSWGLSLLRIEIEQPLLPRVQMHCSPTLACVSQACVLRM